MSGRLVARLAVALASFLVAGGACELALRWHLQRSQGFGTLADLRAHEEGERMPTKSEHPLVMIVKISSNRRLIYDLRPKVDMSFGRRKLVTNAAGERESRDYAPGPHPGVVRVVGIGDSGMWGWAVNQGEEYLSVLEDHLSARPGDTRFEVVNLAVPGYNTQQEVDMLRDRGLAYEPDVVVLGWCDNDFGPPLFMSRPRSFFRWDRPFLVDLALRPQRFRERVQPEVFKLGDVDRELTDPEVLAEIGKEGVERQLAELAALSKAKGFQVILVGPMTRAVWQIAERVGLERYNVKQEIDPATLEPTDKVYGCHPNAAGHRIIADHLEHELDRRGWLVAHAGAAASG